jgi:hypothetical protein
MAITQQHGASRWAKLGFDLHQRGPVLFLGSKVELHSEEGNAVLT